MEGWKATICNNLHVTLTCTTCHDIAQRTAPQLDDVTLLYILSCVLLNTCTPHTVMYYSINQMITLTMCNVWTYDVKSRQNTCCLHIVETPFYMHILKWQYAKNACYFHRAHVITTHNCLTQTNSILTDSFTRAPNTHNKHVKAGDNVIFGMRRHSTLHTCSRNCTCVHACSFWKRYATANSVQYIMQMNTLLAHTCTSS